MEPQPSRSGRSSPRFFSTSSSQSLSSILNNPHASESSSWWPSSVPAPEFSPLSLSSRPDPPPALSDFLPYLSSLSDPLSRFHHIQNHAKVSHDHLTGGGQGLALAACLREVPALYFKEGFALQEGGTFRAACPFASVAENFVLQEKLSQYLDVVEVHLVREISLRSDSFFEAQGQLEDLSRRIVEGCARIRELKETVSLLDADLVASARRIQGLSATRGNLLVLQQKLRLILYVNQAVSALKLLVASGDCAGALDVTDDLQNLLEGEELTGLHCFRHLRDHVAAAIDAVNSILSAEFMRTSVHDTGNMDEVILSKAKARANLLRNGEDDEVKVDEEDTSSFRDRFLPVTIGLLRTAKLPSVLRIYRDTVTADMKGAIKTAVADLLPVLLTRPMESDLTPGDRAADTDGGGSSLASKLRSLSSESFIQLLEAIFNIITAHLVRASEVKRAIEWIMCNIDGHYAADSVASAIALGSAALEAAQEIDGQAASVLTYSSYKNGVPSIQTKSNDGTSTSNLSKNFRADVLRENTEAVFAACDIAHGRWAKLLGVRALVHPRLKLQEFLSIFNVTQEFIAATEKIGGRLGYSIRGTLQSQAKAFIDFQHESRMGKIKAVLDQETWTEVDVPHEFQSIVTSLFCSESLSYGREDNGQENNDISDNVVAATNDDPITADTGTLETSVDKSKEFKSSPSAQAANNRKSDAVASPPQIISTNSKERGKASSQTLAFGGLGYHMVNCGLILVKMLSEYIEMNNYLPVLSSEVVHRVVELLKFFNTRTCQLVLGAGAMQVSGLKSITSKHLALASQVVSFTYAIIPEIRRILFNKVPETRKALLLLEIDRVAQDYKVHRDEIHTKLVQIMRERLLVHLRSLPQIVEGWNRIEELDSLPSQFARSLTKEVGYLQRVLSRTLHEVDVQAIFRQVVIIFHSQISEAFSQLDISTAQAKNRLQRDVEHILGCIRSLPSDCPSETDISNWGQLDEFMEKRFGPVAD